MVITDEVYEHLVFRPHGHLRHGQSPFQCGQDVQLHRLENRMGAAQPNSSPGCAPQGIT